MRARLVGPRPTIVNGRARPAVTSKMQNQSPGPYIAHGLGPGREIEHGVCQQTKARVWAEGSQSQSRKRMPLSPVVVGGRFAGVGPGGRDTVAT